MVNLAAFRRRAELWEGTDEAHVRCKLCPYYCRISEGKRGWCGVRENSGGELQTLIYALVAAAAADPIEKKPLFHFHPGSRVYSVGTVGCNFRCIHCQNWEIAYGHVEDLAWADFVSPAELSQTAKKLGCQGIAWTYNEPTIWIEYAADGAREAKRAGLYTAFVTNGYITEDGLDFIGPYLDAYRVDVKGFRPEFYRELAHVKDFSPVLSAAKRAKHRWKMHVEIVTNVIPTMNDSDAELRAIADWIVAELGADTPWHVTRFYPYLKLEHLPPTPVPTLERALRIGTEAGLHFVYVGNLPGHKGENTFCPSCGNLVIERVGYMLRRYDASGGKCGSCGTAINIRE